MELLKPEQVITLAKTFKPPGQHQHIGGSTLWGEVASGIPPRERSSEAAGGLDNVMAEYAPLVRSVRRAPFFCFLYE